MPPEPLPYDDAYLRGILGRVKTIAMVGASTSEMRPSYFAMLYLQGKGYRVIPVNPRYAGETLLGETVQQPTTLAFTGRNTIFETMIGVLLLGFGLQLMRSSRRLEQNS